MNRFVINGGKPLLGEITAGGGRKDDDHWRDLQLQSLGWKVCRFWVYDWEMLATALQQHGQRWEVTKIKNTGFGPRYEVQGELAALDGRHPRVCTVWQVDAGQIAPRLITAYPLEAI